MDPTKKELYTKKRSSGLNTSADPTISQHINNLKFVEDTNKEMITWILTKIVNDSDLILHALGNGNVPAGFFQNLSEDNIFFGYFKAMVNGKIKFFHFSYSGNNVGAIKKGRGSMFKPTAFSLLDAHGEITLVESLSEATETWLREEIAKIMRVSSPAVEFI